MGPAAERFAQVTAYVFLGAAALEIVLILGSLLADARLLPVPESAFNTPQCPVIFVAFAAALTHLIVTGGGRRRRRAPMSALPPTATGGEVAEGDHPGPPRTATVAPFRATESTRTFVTALAWAIVVLTALLAVLVVVVSILFARTMSDF